MSTTPRAASQSGQVQAVTIDERNYAVIHDDALLAHTDRPISEIAFALKQAESGSRVEEVCRKMGISQATFYAWRKKFGGLGVSELRRLRQLEEENRKLKREVREKDAEIKALKKLNGE